MATFSKNPTNSIFSTKNLLFSITVASVALLLKLYAPLFFESLVSGLPVLKSWFTPPYLYVIVNFIIIAIAASSMFQQQNTDDQGMVTKVVSGKTHDHLHMDYPYSFDDQVSKNDSAMELEVKTIKTPKALEVKPPRKSLKAEKVEVQVGSTNLDAENVEDLKLKTNKKPPVSTSRREKESWREFDVTRLEKHMEGRSSLQVRRDKIETSAKQGQDHLHYPRSKSVGMSSPINSTPSFLSQHKGLTFDYQDNQSLQAGKEGRARDEAEVEENDTLEGTWKMIMERSRSQNAGLQQQASTTPTGFEKVKESNNNNNNMRSPSQSRRKQDTSISNW